MAALNADVVSALNKIADLLEIKGENPFRIRAYRNAARTIESLGVSVEAMLRRHEDLASLPGIGRDLASKIEEFINTGTIGKLEELETQVPAPLLDLLSIEGLGPKRVKVLYDSLGIEDLEGLREAAKRGEIRKLPGFGPKTEEAILKGIKRAKKEGRRFKWSVAEEYAKDILRHLEGKAVIQAVEVAGSFRRKKETVGDLDILVTARDGREAMDHFVAYSELAHTLSHGTTRSSVILKSGIQVDCRVVPKESYGAALAYFTGSKAHNIALRTIGVKKGIKINEYGVFKGVERIGGETEEEVYSAVGLPFIEPELRENTGEIQAAVEGRLPSLITISDIKGDLHCHSLYTDGKDNLKQMAEAARALGYEYIAITDHSRRLTVAKGLDTSRLMEQMAEIEKLNSSLSGITILKGIEVDILEDGRLDLPDEVLKELDVVVASIHYKFKLSKEAQTKRLLKAMDNPHVNIIGHPTGRLIGQRAPYEVAMETVLMGAKERGCFMELNAQPDRLDLNEIHLRTAKEMGVMVAISTDAHSASGLSFMRYGLNQARRGWIEKKDCLNTLPLYQLRKKLNRQ